ncbi:LytR family transcriptional regulator [Streptomyces sp. SID8359]|uniref:LCP family glycopolymer transferase n=1 Tax=Streptomyces sp. SID8359 TaxID=2690343 RepID=UPI00048A823E|nr:LCP family protein [Streptomyces sp. SolWspMP-sol2th]MYT93068.1 LytR family transcriptional regulator [Streptomyces sp. SID8359]
MTDSAGTPADPDHPAGETPQGRSQEGPEATPDTEPDATGPAKEEPGAGTRAEAGSDEKAGADAKPEAGAGSDAKPKADAKAEAGADPKAGTRSGPEGEPKAGVDAEPEPEAEAKTGPEAEPGADPGPRPGPDAEASPAAPAGAGSTGVQTWADHPKDSSASRRKRPWLRWAALGASFLVLVSAGVGWWIYNKLDGNITTDTGAAAELKVYEKERPTPVAMDAQNILLIGSDSRAGDNSRYGRDDGGSQRSDTTILLHLAADRKSATAVSLPRDLMVEIPACRTGDDKETRERFGQFNSAFELGGSACTIRTVERLTGIRIDHHMVVDFNGFKDMVDAVDGVEICLKEPINDKDAHLELPAGRQTLNGEEALGYVRARKTLGDGSDTERMERQQRFLGALVNKMQSNGVLLNPTRLYPVLDAATKSLTTDPGLDSLRDLYDLVRSMRDVPTDQVQFLTVPRQPYRNNPNRDELVEPDAGELFKQLREDKPVAVVPADELKDAEKRTGTETGGDGKPDAAASESPTPTPTYSGSSAADDLCEQ